MPCRPSSPIFGHSSRGKRSVLSSSAAIGATWSAEKRWTWSRSASAVSPRPKSNGGIALGIMYFLPVICLPESGGPRGATQAALKQEDRRQTQESQEADDVRNRRQEHRR